MDNRYWLLDYDPADHARDLRKAIADGQIICLVDEDAGGIVAYVTGEANAQSLMHALNGGEQSS